MNDISRTVSKFLFYSVAVVLLIWTSSLTVTFVQGALPSVFWVVPFLALVIFDGGQVAWLFVFLHYSEGAGQRAVAIVTCLLDFIGVGLMVVAEILLGGQTLTAAPDSLGTYAIWGIGVWTVANVGAVIAFHLFAPSARLQMALQSETDSITDSAFKLLSQMRAEHSQDLANQLANGMMQQLTARLAVDANNNGISDVFELASANGKAEPVMIPVDGQANKKLPDKDDPAWHQMAAEALTHIGYVQPNGKPITAAYVAQAREIGSNNLPDEEAHPNG
jgi:hypothetical protein